MIPAVIPYFETPSIPLFGDLAIHGFGVLVAIGFWVGTWLATVKCRRDGLNPDIPGSLVGYLIVATFVGGHLFHAFFYEWDHYKDNLVELLYFWDGLSSTGGLLCAIGVSIWFLKVKNKVDILPYGDALIWGLMTGWIFGRLGCFVAHDHPGMVSEFALAVQGICPASGESTACHDLGLYEAMWAMVCASAFHVLDRKPRAPGFFMTLMCLFYGPYRFLSDFLRHPLTDERYFGLTPAQYFAIGLTILGIVLFRATRGGTPVRPVATGPTAD